MKENLIGRYVKASKDINVLKKGEYDEIISLGNAGYFRCRKSGAWGESRIGHDFELMPEGFMPSIDYKAEKYPLSPTECIPPPVDSHYQFGMEKVPGIKTVSPYIGKTMLFQNKPVTIIGALHTESTSSNDLFIIKRDTHDSWEIEPQHINTYNIDSKYLGKRCGWGVFLNELQEISTESKIMVKPRGNVLLPTQEVKKRRIIK